MTNLDTILKSREITLPTIKAKVFPVVMYGCESWTIKKAEYWRIDAFELWCWRRLLRVPSIARKSSQSILKEINPKMFIGRTNAEEEAPILWPSDVKSQFIRKDSNAGKDWGQEEKAVAEDEMVGCYHWLNGYEFEQTPEIVKDREAWCALVLGVAKSQTRYCDWRTTKWGKKE